MTPGYDEILLQNDVLVLNIFDNTALNDKPTVLTITYTKYAGHTKPFSADQTDVLSLRLEDTGNFIGVDCKYVPALLDVLRIAESLDLGLPITNAAFITCQANDAYLKK